MKKILVLTTAALISFYSVKAQDRNSGIAVSIGAAANYYYGPGDENFGKYDNDRLNWQANGMLGLTIARDKSGHRTMIAGFGSFGMNNASTLGHILDDQGFVTTALNQNSSNNFYQLEAGLLIGEVFRISTGVGQQVFNKQTLASTDGIKPGITSLQYNSTTVGFNFNVAAVAVIINCNFEYGKDFTKTVVVPSAGLMLRF
ncbi:MAG: hypothetical protein ABI359_06755 [Ginsengibacter sp.]